jgi:hypothetical protein
MKKHNIWAEWYVEGNEVPYTKVIHSVKSEAPIQNGESADLAPLGPT